MAISKEKVPSASLSNDVLHVNTSSNDALPNPVPLCDTSLDASLTDAQLHDLMGLPDSAMQASKEANLPEYVSV